MDVELYFGLVLFPARELIDVVVFGDVAPIEQPHVDGDGRLGARAGDRVAQPDVQDDVRESVHRSRYS